MKKNGRDGERDEAMELDLRGAQDRQRRLVTASKLGNSRCLAGGDDLKPRR